MCEQIERQFLKVKKGGESPKDKYTQHLKKSKVRKERRKAKLDPECFDDYRKYKGYEY